MLPKSKFIVFAVFIMTILIVGLTANFAHAGGNLLCEDDRIAVTVVTNPLDFATLVSCDTLSDVIINESTGTRSTTGCVGLTVGTPVRAQVQVEPNQTGSPATRASKTIIVTVSSTSTISSGANNMTVDTFRLDPCNCASTVQSGGDTVIYNIGSTVGVGANQSAGNYTGTFTVDAYCEPP